MSEIFGSVTSTSIIPSSLSNKVEQTLKPDSENAISSKAVAEAKFDTESHASNNIRRTAKGTEILNVDDASPLNNKIKIKLSNGTPINSPINLLEGRPYQVEIDYAHEFTTDENGNKQWTSNGITWTVNEDGSIHAEGTATNISYFNLKFFDKPIFSEELYKPNNPSGMVWAMLNDVTVDGYFCHNCMVEQPQGGNTRTYLQITPARGYVNETYTPQLYKIAPSISNKLTYYSKNLLDVDYLRNMTQEEWTKLDLVEGYYNYRIGGLIPNTPYTLSMSENKLLGTGANDIYVALRSNKGGFAESGSICHGTSDVWYFRKSSVTVNSNEAGELYLATYGMASPANRKILFDGCPDLMLELGEYRTKYSPYHAPQDIEVGEDGIELVSDYSPSITLVASQGSGIDIELEYNASVEGFAEGLVDEELRLKWEEYGLPILYLKGDMPKVTKSQTSTLSYVYNDTVAEPRTLKGTCKVKWQGSSSTAYPKKNYTITFVDESEEKEPFEAFEGWGEQAKYCFKANYIDHSHARNVVSAKLWGQIVKSRSSVPTELRDLVNGGAVDGFPCIIVVNGEFYGLYTFNIPKDGWMFSMSDKTLQQAILCADGNNDGTRMKTQATVSEEDGADFSLEYVSDDKNASWVETSLNNLISKLNESDGANLDTEIAELLDWQSAIDYYIFVLLLGAEDCIIKNYILTTFDGTKWYFSAYDLDSTYGLHWDGQKFLRADSPVTKNGINTHKVMSLIQTYKLSELKARYAELRNNIMSEANVNAMFENFIGKIPKNVMDEDVKKWTTIPNTEVNNVSQIRDWYRVRVAVVDKVIEAL